MYNLVLRKILKIIPINKFVTQSKITTKVEQKNAGFTLIEVLVVVIMLGVLAAIAAPSWLAFVNKQRLNKVNDNLLGVLQEAQKEAKKRKLSYSISFKNDSNIPQVAIYPQKNPDGTNATPSGWKNLVGDLEIKPGQIVIGTNITSENTSSSSVTYTSAPTFTDTSKPQTITFDYTGALDLLVKTNNDSLTAVQKQKLGYDTTTGSYKGLIVALAVAKPGAPTQPTNMKRCIIVKTILGSIQTAKDTECS